MDVMRSGRFGPNLGLHTPSGSCAPAAATTTTTPPPPLSPDAAVVLLPMVPLRQVCRRGCHTQQRAAAGHGAAAAAGGQRRRTGARQQRGRRGGAVPLHRGPACNAVMRVVGKATFASHAARARNPAQQPSGLSLVPRLPPPPPPPPSHTPHTHTHVHLHMRPHALVCCARRYQTALASHASAWYGKRHLLRTAWHAAMGCYPLAAAAGRAHQG